MQFLHTSHKVCGVLVWESMYHVGKVRGEGISLSQELYDGTHAPPDLLRACTFALLSLGGHRVVVG